MKDRELMQQALKALARGRIVGSLLQQDQDSVIAALSERLAQPDAERVLVMRGQKDKVVAIYRENDVDILRTEIKKEDLLSVWKEKP
jgi:hypothetical protein